MNTEFIVDKIEGNLVLIEDSLENIIEVNIKLIEGQVKEGDCLTKVGEYYKIDKNKTYKRKKNIEDLTKGMWEE